MIRENKIKVYHIESLAYESEIQTQREKLHIFTQLMSFHHR